MWDRQSIPAFASRKIRTILVNSERPRYLARRYNSAMSVVLSIATSGLVAAARRLEVSARNVANALSSGPSPDADPEIKASFPAAYNALRVDQVEAAGGGTLAVGSQARPGTAWDSGPNAAYTY